MDQFLAPSDLAFKEEVKAFLAANLPADIVEATRRTTTVFVEKDVALKWQKILNEKGWLAYNWPVEYGGTGWTPLQRLIFERECALAGAPGLIPLGLRYVAPVIFTFGSDTQKEYYLPRILNGDDYWCQGYSEPGAGSDLASLQCRAERDGDHYIVNGTKIWTTHAHFANMMFCLVRTKKTERRQEGISFLLIDMTLPGVTVQPILTLGGDHEVNQVFFDNVRIPAENLVGEENKGWTYAKYLLEWERAGASYSGQLRHSLNDLKVIVRAEQDGYGRPLIESPGLRADIIRTEADISALEMTEIRLFIAAGSNATVGVLSSLIKNVAASLKQRLGSLSVEALGYNALPLVDHDPRYDNKPEEAPIPDYAVAMAGRQLNDRAATIYGGATEVQRDIIAKMLFS